LIEEWRDVVGYEGCYKISNYGKIYSIPRPSTRGGMIKPYSLKTGHLQVGLSRYGVETTWAVHRLVAAAFFGPCPEGQEVRHGPAGVADNSTENLCYGTRAENVADRTRDGTQPVGERNNHAKLTEIQVIEILGRIADGDLTDAAIAREYELARSTVHRLRHGDTWKHLPRGNTHEI
jgi:hypothetical protein